MKFPVNFCQILFRHFVAQVGNKTKVIQSMEGKFALMEEFEIVMAF